jgi:hypothetical protein
MMNNVQPRVVPAKNLQGAFESAVRDIYQARLTGKASPYRTPIVQRIGVGTSSSRGNAEKQALSDAASALAQLWKVSTTAHR